MDTGPTDITQDHTNRLAAKVSVFQGSSDTSVIETVSLETMLQRIQDGTYQAATTRLRQLSAAGDKAQYTRAKEKSVAFTPGCALTTRKSTTPWAEKLVEVTGLVQLDVDEVDDPEAMKAALAGHPAVVFAFVSPGGRGVKVGIAATGISDPDTYKHAWGVVVQSIHDAYPPVHINVDEHVKFLHALCYVSHDPRIYINPDATALAVPPPAPRRQRPLPPQGNEADYSRVAGALACIPNHDADYDAWLELGMALHSTGASWARDLWESWSRQSGKYDEHKQDKSWRGFNEDGKTTIGTLFHQAKQHGWQPPPPPKLVTHHRQQPVPDMTQTASTDAGQYQHGHATHAHALLIEGDSLEDEDIVYLWPPYIPRKMPSILDGDPGVGKTMLACQIAASVSRGYALPDQQGVSTGPPGEPGHVLMVAMEDHLSAVVKKRLVACHADLSKITFVNDIVDGDGNPRPFTLADIPLLSEYMATKRPRFVYIDAIQAVLGATVDINRANQVTALLRPLKTLAEAYDCAIVCSRHPAKPGQNVAKLIHRGMASQAFVGTARSALFVEEHPMDKSKSLLVHYKSNTGELGRTQVYSKAGYVEWCGVTRITKDTLSGSSSKGASPQAVLEACIWLEERLEGNLTWNAKDIETEAAEEDISKNVLQRAKKTLGVISTQIKGDAHAGWQWRLPPMSLRLSTAGTEGREGREGTEGTEVPDLKTKTCEDKTPTTTWEEPLASDTSDTSVPSDTSDTQVPKVEVPLTPDELFDDDDLGPDQDATEDVLLPCPRCGAEDVTVLLRAGAPACVACSTLSDDQVRHIRGRAQFDEIEAMYQQQAEEVPAPLIPDEPFGQLDLRDQPPPCFACRGTVYWANASGMLICARCHPQPSHERS